ncbi:YbaB/EbfC family nucleoid-associated protein [Rhodocytophaga aerolata]|uniref:Nucleoid-associated protein Q0590_15225 n=1 Tax=Rhodocytophaga aerolata TaxID=455078 RepID=A0ABT8R688_9BACT|nr:YbaB/EbfC family nucleoid-associated protein [Rhodocytophaga aerolata]MDO1447620.1 YbaB/EbfC family nucleoid-associated protein [Rhodocytophaga aerolata]
MFDMMGMLGKVKELQAKMKEAQDNLVHVQASAEAGAGMVKATVNGKKQLVSLEIDPDVIKPDDKEMMQDLIVAAVNKALAEVDVKAKEELKKTTQGIMPNIPGLDLGSMF